MLNPNIKKQLREIFDVMQETAFAHPIRKSEEILSEITTGKFSQPLPLSEQWFVSVCLTICPEDDNQKHFWAASLAYISKLTGKPKSRLLWTNKETELAKEVLHFLMQDVGLVDEEDIGEVNPVRIFGKKVALHAHKNLSSFEKETLAEILEVEVAGN